MEKTVYSALGESVWHGRLPNGLHIYVDEKPEYGKQFAFFAACYGGMDLRFPHGGRPLAGYPAGVAHFLEHKLSTPRRTLSDPGGQRRGGERLYRLIPHGVLLRGDRRVCGKSEHLAVLCIRTLFYKGELDKEQGIIAQEIRMGEDNPDLAIYICCWRRCIRHTPSG